MTTSPNQLSAQSAAMKGLTERLQSVDCYNFPPDGSSLVDTPVGQELANNDGSQTFLVHGTKPASAQKAFETGFRFSNTLDTPGLSITTFMLEGPDSELPQAEANQLLLDYRHVSAGTTDTFEPAAKLVLQFPFERPANPSAADYPLGGRPDPHDLTPLREVGHFIQLEKEVKYDAEGIEAQREYRIPRQYVKGYFDQGTGEFVPNPHFGEDQKRSGSRVRRLARAIFGLRR